MAGFERPLTVWHFLDTHKEAAKTALGRWLADQTEANEFLRQLNLLDIEQHRLRCLAKTEEAKRTLDALIEDRVSRLTGAYNAVPLDLPLPPARNRTLPPDSCLAALTALNDETRDPSQKIGLSGSSLYRVLCSRVRELQEEHLPALRAFLRTAAASLASADCLDESQPSSKAEPGQPSQDRQDDIIAALVAKGTPLTRPELVSAMRLRTEGKLGHQLAWMVRNNILLTIPRRGYWPAGRPVPE